MVGVPINYRLTPAEAAYIVDDSDAVVVYVDAEYAETFTSNRNQMPKVRHIVTFGGPPPAGAIDGDALIASASDAEPAAADAEFVSLTYTSGTGHHRPQGALRGATDLPQLKAMLEFVGHVPDDVYLTTGPLYHSGPGGYLGVAHLLGNTAVLQRRFEAEDWLRLVATYRVSMTFAAPTPIRLVCNLPAEVKARYDRSSMRRMIANAAPWSFALKEAYMADFGEDSLWEVYGSTELGVDTILAPADQRRKPGACGQPAPGVGDSPVRRGWQRGDRAGRAGRGLRPRRRQLHHVLQSRGARRRSAAGRLRHGWRYCVPRRGRFPVHLRPQERHDHLGWDEHLSREWKRPWSSTRASSRPPCSAFPTTSGANWSTPSWCPALGTLSARKTWRRSPASIWPGTKSRAQCRSWRSCPTPFRQTPEARAARTVLAGARDARVTMTLRLQVGSHMLTIMPWPSPSLWAHIRPECASAMRRQMCRPRPMPGSSPRVALGARPNGSKMRSCAPGVSPMPASLTVSTTPPSAGRKLTPISPPPGEYLTELLSRLSRTCSSRPASPATIERRRAAGRSSPGGALAARSRVAQRDGRHQRR